MRLGGRIQAAIEVVEDILSKRTPAAHALRDWGKSHRFAGSKDRSFIGLLVYDVLRTKSSTAYRMGGQEAARALVLGTLCFYWEMGVSELENVFNTDPHSPEKLDKKEISDLSGKISLDGAPEWIQADIPEWIWPAFENNFAQEAINEGRALCARPPLDLRVNLLKTEREKALEDLTQYGARPTNISPVGIRIPAGQGESRLPNIQSDPVFLTGQVEIQDEGSQLVAQLVAPQNDDKVLDYCAGGGGKSLALAADIAGKGHIYAYDIDKRRLAPLYARAARAGADNIEICQPPVQSLSGLVGEMDRVLVDAPCTGSGTWRRKPDAKWRLSPETLELRIKEQAEVLSQAQAYVKPGGYLFYVTCSVFAEENENQIYGFLDENADFELLSAGEVWEERFGVDKPKPWSEDGCTVTLTPASTQTDGFFFAVMQRKI